MAHDNDYGVYNNSLPAIERAIKERVFFVDYGEGFVRPHAAVDSNYHSNFSFSSKIRELAQYTTPMSEIQFSLTFVGRRRVNYLLAAKSLELRGVNRKDAHIKAFIKAEKYNFTKKPNPAPRIIQPRDVRYIVAIGRYIKPIEKKIFKAINNVYGATTVFKGLNAEQRGGVMRQHWCEYKSPVAVGLDAKRFDQHVSKSALEWEHSIYKMFYPGDKHFAKLLSWQVNNIGTARCNGGRVDYNVEGCRMSGDSNTALGNCLIMCALVYQYTQTLGIKISLANDGDDCVVIMEQAQLPNFQQGLRAFFVDHGFEMTVEDPVYIFEEIEFCQCHPVFDGNKYIMVRDPRVAVSKDTVAIKPLDNNKVLRRWCAAVGEGGLSLTAGLPIWQEYYSFYQRVGQGFKPLTDPSMETGMQRMSKGMHRTPSAISPQARYSFWLAFKITPACQVAIEDEYRLMSFASNSDTTRFRLLPFDN